MNRPHSSPAGRVAFVGAGPGAADLLTLRALERLQEAEVVVHDTLVPQALLASVAADIRRIPVPQPSADSADDPGTIAGRLLAELAGSGLRVVRLKGGDPTVFARLVEEIAPLREAGIPFEIVPGVTAALAAAAAAAAPVTSRAASSCLTLVTGHEAAAKADAVDFQPMASLAGTIAVYMGVERAAQWSRDLLAAGRPPETPVTIVSRCSWPDEQVATTTLGACAADFDRHGWPPPAVALVGDVLRTPAGPLTGRTVLVTRPAGQGEELTALVRAAGGSCIQRPLSRVEPPPSWDEVDAALARLDTFDWVVLSSVNGVRGFRERLRATGRDGRALGSCRIAAIGPATRRAVEAGGFVVDLSPTAFRSEGLLEAFADAARGTRFLLLRADRGRDLLRTGLEANGHHVEDVTAYRSVPIMELDAAAAAALEGRPVDWVTATSPSIAAALVACFGPRLRGWKVASLSPVTTAALVAAGVHPTVEAGTATAVGLVAAIIAWETAATRQAAESTRPADLPVAGPR